MGPIRAEVLVGIILLLFFPLYVCVRPPHLLFRHVETTVVRAEGGEGISLPLVLLSCVHSHIHTCCLVPEPEMTVPRPVLSVSVSPFPSSPLRLFSSVIPLLLVLTLRDVC